MRKYILIEILAFFLFFLLIYFQAGGQRQTHFLLLFFSTALKCSTGIDCMLQKMPIIVQTDFRQNNSNAVYLAATNHS